MRNHNSSLGFQKYIENVKQDTNIGTNILRVSASDEDADNNGAIRYSITAPVDPTDLDYFDIQPESGWIYLRKPLDVSQSLAIPKKMQRASVTVTMTLVSVTIACSYRFLMPKRAFSY